LAIVIDALDECTGVQYVPGLIQLFSRARNLHMVQLRIFLTSRRESYIQEMFNKVPHVVYHDLMLDSANDTDQTKQDISVFIADELAKVAVKRKLANWPSREDTQSLVQKADRLFIYAATVCRYLADCGYPRERLPEILENQVATHSSTAELDQMYMLVMRQTYTGCNAEEKPRQIDLSRRVIGPVIVMQESLSVSTLAQLLSIPEHKIRDVLECLHAVLDIPKNDADPIHMHHLSLREFLINHERCTDPAVYVDEGQANNQVLMGRNE
jgi:hypothetical protein